MDEAKKWLQMAHEDLLWAEASLKEEIWRGACFAAQQAAEKSLKAYLLTQEKPIQKIHDLVSLNESCKSVDAEFEKVSKLCNFLSPYYLSTRYPDVAEFEEYNSKMAQEAVQNAKEIIEFIGTKIS